MQVDHQDLWMLLLSTVRYSFGRQTYMTSLAWELVVQYHEALNFWQLRQISREILDEARMYRRAGKRLPDESTWVRGAMRIHRLARKRKL